MKTDTRDFIVILLLSAILAVTLGNNDIGQGGRIAKQGYGNLKCTSDGVGGVNIEQAIQSGGLVYDR